MDDMMWFLLGLANGGGKVKPITITENGVYNAPEGYVGFEPVTVDAPQSCLNMCDLFEQQTPIAVIPLFGDYTAKLVQLPEGIYYSRYRNYNYYLYTDTPVGDITGCYCSQDYRYIVCAVGVYRGDTLLYIEYPTSNVAQEYRYSTETIYDDVGNITGVNVYKEKYSTNTHDFTNVTVSSDSMSPTNYYKNFQVPYTHVETTYTSDGAVSGEYTNQYNWQLGAYLNGYNWYYTRFTGDEQVAQMDQVVNDVFAEYQRNQST